MKSPTLLILVLGIIIYSSCSKSHSAPLTPEQTLLEAKPWDLQSSDTIHYDLSYNETAHTTADLSDCDFQLHYFFASAGRFSGNIGCVPLADFETHQTWELDNNNIILYGSSDPRSGPPNFIVDSILLLTTDSLILRESIAPNSRNGSINYSPVPLLIHSVFTH